MTMQVEAGQVQAATPFWRKPAVMDRVEQAIIVALWIWFAFRVEFNDNPYAPLLLISETAIAFFTLIRRPTTKLSMRLGDWLLAMTATAAPLLITPGVVLVPALTTFGIVLMIMGNLGQLWAKFVLRRSFGIAPANRGVKNTGPYAIVRHPMYASYLLIHIGVMLLMFTPINLIVYIIGWWAQILRLQAEERVLSQDPAYRDFMKKTRWRLIPGIF